jgi:hypothetical protein
VAPVPVGNPGSRFSGWTDFLPSHRGLSISNAAIREYAAILWYMATGRFGWRDLIT